MINFADSLDDNSTLYLAVNNRRTQLTAGISDSATTVPVITTSGYPATGFVSILTGSDITQTEAIKYTGITSTTFTGATRGADGTTAVPHASGNNVDLTIVADHHNALKDAVMALEHFVGVSGSENFLGQDEYGNVTVTGNLTVDETLGIGVVAGGPYVLDAQGDFVRFRNNTDGSLELRLDCGATTAQNSTIHFMDQGFSKWYLYKDSNNKLVIYDAVQEHSVFQIESDAGNAGALSIVDGRVGIGTVSPTEKLHVVGSGYFTGDVDVDGTLTADTGTFTTSLTVSGEPVVIGGGASTLQDAYDNGDGTITTTAEKPLDVDHGAFSDSLTVSGETVSTGTATSTYKGTMSFTTASVAGEGGVNDSDESGFNNRSLVRKLKVTPNGVDITAFQIDFYKSSAFTEDKLEYRATASGTFIDNDVWFHEDEDGVGELHLRVTNDAVNASTFSVELTAEVFA